MSQPLEQASAVVAPEAGLRAELPNDGEQRGDGGAVLGDDEVHVGIDSKASAGDAALADDGSGATTGGFVDLEQRDRSGADAGAGFLAWPGLGDELAVGGAEAGATEQLGLPGAGGEAGVGRPKLEDIEQRLYEDAILVTEAMLKFADIDPRVDEPPSEWIAEFGEKEALRRYAIAKASWLSAKEAPIALSVAPKLLVGIASARAKRNESTNPVTINNIIAVQIPSPEVQYPRLVVKSG